MSALRVFAVVLLAAISVNGSAQSAAKPSDVSTYAAIIEAAYASISGPAHKPRDWARLNTLFSPSAQFVMLQAAPDGSTATANVMNLRSFRTGFLRFLHGEAFYERQVSSRNTQFGNIVNVISVYESRHHPNDTTPFQRGINSFQLYSDGHRWWIQSLMWQDETEKDRIPASLLSMK